MPLYEFECQECGEKQLVATPPGIFEAVPSPCSYCSGQQFRKLVGSVAVATEAVQARAARVESALAKEEASAQGCHHCGGAEGFGEED